jgi:hypothetical protein
MRASAFASKLRRRKRMSIEVLEDRQLLATITVNTTADDTTADATLSLRQAIEVSDGTLAVSSLSTQEQAQVSGAVGELNLIDFKIPPTDPGYNPATGVWTIAPKSALPAITTNGANIDGYSQPGASQNALNIGDNAKLAIAITGAGLGTVNGLTINSGENTTQVSGLDIENFGGAGVLVQGGGAIVEGCFIGTGPTGETAEPNGNGVVFEGVGTIGGTYGYARNVISGNSGPGAGYGIYVPAGLPSAFVWAQDNYIGTDATGTKALGNSAAGVGDFGSLDAYGYADGNGTGNLISGNGAGGLIATGSISIGENLIGTDATGNVALGNGPAGCGIIDSGAGNTAINTDIENNIVSGNAQTGIEIDGGSQSESQFTITANGIGTNIAENAVLGNGGVGLLLNSVENANVEANYIGGNNIGLQLTGSGPDVEHNVFGGNQIGVGKLGNNALPNKSYGVSLTSAIGNFFGPLGFGGNVIAFNGGDGIHVSGGQQNQFSQNSIFANAGTGIKLLSGANQSATPPVMTFTPGTGSTGTLSGTLTAGSKLAYVVEIFSNPSAPAAGLEQGKTFVKDVTVNTDGSGKGTFSVTVPMGYYTATATDPSGNTSAFSQSVGSVKLPATVVALTSSSNPSTVGQQVTFTAEVTATGYEGTPTGTVTFSVDGQAQSPVALALVGGVDQAQFTTSTLAAGSHTVSASYSGDANVGASSGSLPTETVAAPGLQTTTTTLASSLDPSTVGQPVTFTAVVTAPSYQGTPTGTVTFTIDGQAQTPVSLALVGGSDQAQFTASTLSAGSHSVLASYSGDNHVGASSGSLPTQTVNAPGLQTTTTTLASSLNPSTVGQPVTFTAVVSPSETAGTPSGSVTFTIDGVSHAPVPLQLVSGRDQATLSIASLGAGTHTISAAYSGDSSLAASAVAMPLVETVAVVTHPGAVDGPTIELVQRFGIHMQPTVLVLSFNEALDLTSAVNPDNYRITDPAGRSVGISSAVFDPKTNTVTLRPAERINLHHTYHLTVIGTGPDGVRSTTGLLLDGTDKGTADSNYKGTLDWRNVVLTPAELRKYVHPNQAKPAGALNHHFHGSNRSSLS